MRFVVVEIPDNDEAEDFIHALLHGEVIYSSKHGEPEGEIRYKPLSDPRVPQVYAVPTLFCECPNQSEKSARSMKYGWWCCAKCSKPKRGAMQHPFNLMERDVDARHRVYYMGFRADRRPWRIPLKEEQ